MPADRSVRCSNGSHQSERPALREQPRRALPSIQLTRTHRWHVGALLRNVIALRDWS